MVFETCTNEEIMTALQLQLAAILENSKVRSLRKNPRTIKRIIVETDFFQRNVRKYFSLKKYRFHQYELSKEQILVYV